MAQTSIGTGFLYNGIDGSSGVTPVCCTPEYLAAYGVGLDSTLGDGKVQGVLREDQAEQQFYAMYKDQYDGAEELQSLTKELQNFVGTVKDGTNIKDLMKQATAINNGTTPEAGAGAKPKVGADGKPTESSADKVGADGKPAEPSADAVKLAAILKDIEAKISANPKMEPLLTQFFGEETVKNAGGGTAGTAGLASLMAGTVISSYDVPENSKEVTGGGGDKNGINDLSISQEDKTNIGKNPAVSLGEIFQWSLETNAFLQVATANGAGNVAEFAKTAYTAMSEGDTATFNGIAQKAGMDPEQLQVILSSMMNNHSNLMSTGGTFGTSAKNGAHEYLNNINDVWGGDDRGFQFLHIGNLSANNKGEEKDENGNIKSKAGDSAGNDDLNSAYKNISAGTAELGFTGGDNGNGNNGGIEVLNNVVKDANPIAMTAKKPAATLFEGEEGTKLKSELLDDLSKQGVGLSKNKSFDAGASMAFEDGAPVKINGETYNVNVTDSEDFENEGYDVVIITITDANGLVVGSMTATEDTTTGRMVEFADNNGDGAADKVDLEETTEDGTLGLSATEWKADADPLAGSYGDAGENGEGKNRGSFKLNDDADAMAMNEDANDEWNRIAETDPISTLDKDNTLLTGINDGAISEWTGTGGGAGTADKADTGKTVGTATGIPAGSPLASLPKDIPVTSGTVNGKSAYAVPVDTNSDSIIDDQDDENIFALYGADGKLISELPANILTKYLPNTDLAKALGSSTESIKTSYIDGLPYYVTSDGEYFNIDGTKAENIKAIDNPTVDENSALGKIQESNPDLPIVQVKGKDNKVTYLVPQATSTGDNAQGDQYQVYDEDGELKDYKDNTTFKAPTGSALATAISNAGNDTPVHKEYINGVEYYVVGGEYFTLSGTEVMNPIEQDRKFLLNNLFLNSPLFQIPAVPKI